MNDSSQKTLSDLAKGQGSGLRSLGRGHKMSGPKIGFVKENDCYFETQIYEKEECGEEKPCESKMYQHKHDGAWKYGYCVNYIFWFFIIAIITWFILFILKPSFIQTKDVNGNVTGDINNGKLLVTAIIVAIIIIIILALFAWGTKGY